MTSFQKHFQADGSFKYYEIEHSRFVDEGYYILVDWLQEGNIPEEIPYVEPPPYIAPIPSLTPRQLRLLLLQMGIQLTAIDQYIEAIVDPAQKAIAKVEWEYASEYKRDHQLVVQIGEALGMTSEQMDEGFRQASLL